VTAFPSHVRIREVGPRDGFQNEPEVIPSSEKVRLIELLGGTGLTRIEVTSFVRPDESVERAVGIVASRLTSPLVSDARSHADRVRLLIMHPYGPVSLFAGADLLILRRKLFEILPCSLIIDNTVLPGQQ